MTKSVPMVCATLAFVWANFATAEPNGNDILKAAVNSWTQQKSLSFTAEVTYRGKFGENTEELVSDYVIAGDRQGRASVRMSNPELEVELYSTGERVQRYVPMFKQFMDEEQSITPSELVRASGFSIIEPTIAFLSELLDEAPFTSALENDVEYVAEENEGDVSLHHLKAKLRDRNFDLWLTTGATPQLVRLEADMSDVEAQMAKEGQEANVDVMAQLSN